MHKNNDKGVHDISTQYRFLQYLVVQHQYRKCPEKYAIFHAFCEMRIETAKETRSVRTERESVCLNKPLCVVRKPVVLIFY